MRRSMAVSPACPWRGFTRIGTIGLLVALLVLACAAPGALTTAPPASGAPPASSPSPSPVTPGPSEDTWVTATFSDIGASFRHPSAWRYELMGESHTFEGPNGEGLIFWSASRDELAEFTLPEWSMQQLRYWQSSGTVVATVSTTVGGADSSRLTVHTNSDDQTLFVISEAFLHGDLAYCLAWQSALGNETADTAIFQKVVDSLEFIPVRATPSPSGSASSRPESTSPSDAQWEDYVGHGVRLSRPAEWSVTETAASVEFAAPDGITWLQIANYGSAEGITAKLLADATLMNARETLGSTDAVSTTITLGGAEAVVVRFHNTGDTGIQYYRLKVIAIHDGAWFEMVLYSRTGHETASEEFMKSFLESLEFTG